MNILVFGDSLAWGACDTESSGWADRLKSYINKKTDFDSWVYNLGIATSLNSSGLVDFFEPQIKSKMNKYDNNFVIIISVGMNDAQCNKDNVLKVSPELYIKNIRKIIKTSRKYTEKIIFLGNVIFDESKTTPVPWNKNAFYKNKNVDKIFSILKKVCKNEKIHYIELGKLPLYKDGLHPNSEGHKLIFEKVKDFLVKNKII